MDSPLASRGTDTSVLSTDWQVICLCAQWCGVCREYAALFNGLAEEHPRMRFQWVDVEDEEDVVGDLDVETFPTLLIAQGTRARFLGPLLPQAGVLDRLLRSLKESSAPAATDTVAQGLLARLQSARG